MIEIPLRQFVPWLAVVLLATWAGYPGVVCITPMAWLLTLRVGLLCVLRSKSEQPSRRLLEATLAGGFLGFLQGILFIVIIPLMGPIQTSEQSRTILLTFILLIVGIAAGAALSFITAYLNERRRQAPKTIPQ
jgi:Na+/H+-translocating membrane pyrophosphatase